MWSPWMFAEVSTPRASLTDVTDTAPGKAAGYRGPSFAFGAEPRSPALATTSAPLDVAYVTASASAGSGVSTLIETLTTLAPRSTAARIPSASRGVVGVRSLSRSSESPSVEATPKTCTGTSVASRASPIWPEPSTARPASRLATAVPCPERSLRPAGSGGQRPHRRDPHLVQRRRTLLDVDRPGALLGARVGRGGRCHRKGHQPHERPRPARRRGDTEPGTTPTPAHGESIFGAPTAASLSAGPAGSSDTQDGGT